MINYSRFGVLAVLAAVVVSGCAGVGVRQSAPGIGGTTERSVKRAPLEIKSQESLPYTARLTYGEICFNSKRYGREFCFPCYNADQGGCDGAIEDLVDKAIACSSPIGPTNTFNRAPTYNFPQPTPFLQQQTFGQAPVFQTPMSVPNVYPNFSR